MPTRLAKIVPDDGSPAYYLPYSEVAALYMNGTIVRDLIGNCFHHRRPLEPRRIMHFVEKTPLTGHPPPLTSKQLIATAEAAAASASSGATAEARVYISALNTVPALVAALLAERKGSYRFFPHSPIPAGFNIPCPSVEGAQAYARVLQKYGVSCEVKAPPSPIVSELDLHWGPAPRTPGPPAPLIRNLTSEELENILAERPPPPAAEPEPSPPHLHLTTPCK